MCTAITYTTKDHYFGRTFDWEVSYGESIIVTPRNYPLHFRCMGSLDNHYAIMGMGLVADNYPLYYDAINEKGLGIAGLNFPDNADYKKVLDGVDNVAPFELILWILGQCDSVQAAKTLLKRINLVKIPFGEDYPLSPLHWIFADKNEAITVECVREGIKIYDNPLGVLTNNPPFDKQMFHLNNFMHLSNEEAVNGWGEKLKLASYSRGMGAMGLPGDWSSASRFVRASFVKMNSVSGESEEESVAQFFHILSSVEQIRGCVLLGESTNGEKLYEISHYTSCCNLDKGLYYYKTYGSNEIITVDMHEMDLDAEVLQLFS